MNTLPTEFTFRGETYTRTRIDGRRHNSKCECCGYTVHTKAPDFAFGRKVLHTSCVANGCPVGTVAPLATYRRRDPECA